MTDALEYRVPSIPSEVDGSERLIEQRVPVIGGNPGLGHRSVQLFKVFGKDRAVLPVDLLFVQEELPGLHDQGSVFTTFCRLSDSRFAPVRIVTEFASMPHGLAGRVALFSAQLQHPDSLPSLT